MALVVTSLLRQRIGYRVWRTVHWAAYLCWPIAFVHGLGTGSDGRVGWVLGVDLVCLAAVAGRGELAPRRPTGSSTRPAGPSAP